MKFVYTSFLLLLFSSCTLCKKPENFNDLEISKPPNKPKTSKYSLDHVIGNLSSIREITAPFGGVDGILEALRRYRSRVVTTGPPLNSPAVRAMAIYLRKKQKTPSILKKIADTLGVVNNVLTKLGDFGVLHFVASLWNGGAGSAGGGTGGAAGAGAGTWPDFGAGATGGSVGGPANEVTIPIFDKQVNRSDVTQK